VKTTVFRLTCVVNALALVATGLLGVVAPDRAMNVMTGLNRAWDPDVMSLMRMHNGADFGLGIGFLLVALRPERAFAALVLCLFADVAHGVVHLIDEVQGHHHLENVGPIGVLIGMSAIIALLYPWREGYRSYRLKGMA
jgi:hypothetical protein